MKVLVLATRGCSHCKTFSKELDEIGIEHEIHYCDDEPELVEKYAIRHSPNLIVDDEVIFFFFLTEHELRDFFKL